jgi:hypothetical protein
MGSGFYPQLRGILLAHGCTFVRHGQGSHKVWYSQISGHNFPVAVTVTVQKKGPGSDYQITRFAFVRPE